MNVSSKFCFDSRSSGSIKPLSDVNNVADIKCSVKHKNFKQTSNVELRDGDSKRRLRLRPNKNYDEHQHKRNSKTFICALCQKRFKSKRGLVVHLALQSHKIPSKCGICHELCSSSKQLIEHSLLHSKTVFNPDQHFQAKRSIISSKNSHGKENSFPCTFCPKVFIRQNSLKNHMNIHSNETFVCKFCEKNFIFKSGFLKHLLKVHCITAENLSEKDSENKLLQSSSKTHLNQSVPSNPEINDAIDSCVLCDENFPTSYELGLHLIQHAEDYEKLCANSKSCDDDSDIEILN